MNGIYFDIFFLVFVVGSCLFGAWRGGIRQLMNIVSSLLAIRIAAFIYTYLGDLFYVYIQMNLFRAYIFSFILIFVILYGVFKLLFWLIILSKEDTGYETEEEKEQIASKVKPVSSMVSGFILGGINGVLLFMIFLHILIDFSPETKTAKTAHNVSKTLKAIRAGKTVVNMFMGRNKIIENAKIIIENHPYSYLYIYDDPTFLDLQNQPVFDGIFEQIDDPVKFRDLKTILGQEQFDYILAKEFVRPLFVDNDFRKYLLSFDPSSLEKSILDFKYAEEVKEQQKQAVQEAPKKEEVPEFSF